MVERLRAIGVDEIACLIDFGLPDEVVLEGLERLAELKLSTNSQRRSAASSIADEIREHAVSHLQCTPSLASALLADADTRAAMRHVRTMLVGGEPLTAELAGELRKVVGGRVLNMYGPTETTVWSTADLVGDDTGVTLGRPLDNTRVWVLNDRLEPLPVGAAGEIVIGGQGVARGYWNRPDLTAARFVPDPFEATRGLVYRTGDIGRFLADGRLEFLGRRDRQVKIRGMRAELEEIERVLASHPDVGEAAVVSTLGPDGSIRLDAFCTSSNSKLDLDELREFARGHLPEPMVPATVTLVDALPKTIGGKVDHTSLRVALWVPNSAVPPDGPIEAALQYLWCELLRAPSVGVEDDFFDVGGHSLLAVQLCSRIRDTLKIDLPLRILFEERTIRRLSRALPLLETTPGVTERAASLFVHVAALSDSEVTDALSRLISEPFSPVSTTRV
jgi:acyl-CoA synthetase (AMP-forming)/AMP-acid ligase II